GETMTKLMRTVLQRGRRAGLAGGVFLLAAISALLVIHPGGAAAGGGNRTTPNEANVARSPLGVQVNAAIDHMTARNENVGSHLDCHPSPATAFVEMPGMTVTFKIAGTINRNALVLFQSEFQNTNDAANLRVVVDGNVQSGPGAAGSPVGFVSGAGTGG